MNRTLVIGAVALTSILCLGCKEKPYELAKLKPVRAAEEARRNWLLMGNEYVGNQNADEEKVNTATTDSLINDKPILTDSMTKDSL